MLSNLRKSTLSKESTLRKMRTLIGIIFLFQCFTRSVFFETSYAQELNFSEIERIRMREEIQKHVSDIVEKSVTLAELIDKRKPIVQVEISIDKKRLNEEFLKHQKAQKDLEIQQNQTHWKESTSRFLDFLKAAREFDKQEEKTAPKETNDPFTQPGQRFGILNTGTLAQPRPADSEKPKETKPTQSISPNINFSAPSAAYQATQFTYSLTDFVSNIKVKVHVPTEFKENLRAELRTAIVELLGLSILTQANASENINFINLPDVSANDSEKNREKISWFKEAINPKNQSLSGIFLSLSALIGFVLIAAILFLGSKKVAESLANIAQATQAKSQADEGTSSEGETISADLPSTSGSSSAKSKFSPDKEADLLSQTRLQISENVAQWCTKDPVTVGEVLVDLASAADGMSTLNSLILYSGYENLKPALELLPNKLLRKLDESLNDSWKEGAELLPGLEAAQLLLAGMIPRQTSLLRFTFDSKKIRQALLKLDLTIMQSLINELTNDDACILFRLLPQNVAVAVSSQITPERLKEIMDNMNSSDPNKVPSESLVKKIEAYKENLNEQKSLDKERFLRALLKSGQSSNEEQILNLLGPNDLVLRFEFLQERFFINDLIYLEPATIKSVIDRFPLTRRANFLYFSSPELRQTILDSYPKDSKSLEALLEELDNIDKSQKRKNSANADKKDIFSLISSKTLELLKKDASLRLSVIEKIANSLNTPLPQEITLLSARSKDSAA